MTDETKNASTSEQPANTNLEKDPENWTTGDEPMTGAQKSYLQTLCEEAGESFDPNLTKAQASEWIDSIQDQVGRSGG